MLRVALTVLIVAFSAAAFPTSRRNLTVEEEEQIEASVKVYQTELKKCIENNCGTEVDIIDKMAKPTFHLDSHISVDCIKDCFMDTITPAAATAERIYKKAGWEEPVTEIKQMIKYAEAVFESRKKAKAIPRNPYFSSMDEPPERNALRPSKTTFLNVPETSPISTPHKSGWNLTDAEEEEIRASFLVCKEEMKECCVNKCGAKDRVMDKMFEPTYHLENNINVDCIKDCFMVSVKPVMATFERILKKGGKEEGVRQIREFHRYAEAWLESQKKNKATPRSPNFNSIDEPPERSNELPVHY